jgi:PadR family transcriptional regulator PadR
MSSPPSADVLREAKKGSAELVILAVLEGGPRHGYELASRIDEVSGGAIGYNFASLYASLYKLEERGWIQGRWVEKSGQRRRRYYRITAAGTSVLGRQRDEWKQFVLALGRIAGITFA